MEPLDTLRLNFDPNQRFLLNLLLGFLLFGVALDIQRADFEVLWKRPKSVIVGLLIQWALMPLLTIVLIHLFHPPTSIAIGMILISACPGGNISNYSTHLAKGNAALAVTTTSISTLAAVVTMPLIFSLGTKCIPNLYELKQNIEIDTWEMLKLVTILMLFPLLSGMMLAHRFTKWVARIKQPVRIMSLVIFISFIVGALIGNWGNLQKYIQYVFGISLIFNALALTLGYCIAKLARLSEADARAITFETGVHNTTLGLILGLQFFEGLGGMILVVAWYGIWDLITAYLLAQFWQFRSF